jgi:hypothetical protein
VEELEKDKDERMREQMRLQKEIFLRNHSWLTPLFVISTFSMIKKYESMFLFAIPKPNYDYLSYLILT